jgi:hypothetical protein
MDVIRQDAIWFDFFYTELTPSLRRGEICGLIATEILLALDPPQSASSRSSYKS